MPTYSLQQEFKASILDRDMSGLEKYIEDKDEIPADVRLNVYQNNYYSSLIETLSNTFPTIEDLVSTPYFKNLARLFVKTHPPESGCLHEYGAAFASFLKRYKGMKDYPYMPDVARLDWARHEVYYEIDTIPAGKNQFEAINPDQLESVQFIIAPALRLIESKYPLDEIWQLVYEGRKDQVDINSKGSYVLVCRPRYEVQQYWINEVTFKLITLINQGTTTGQAFECLVKDYKEEDIQIALAFIISKELITNIQEG